MKDKKSFEDDLDIKWEMDLERDKKARENMFPDTSSENIPENSESGDTIESYNDSMSEKAVEKLLDEDDVEDLDESLDLYERNMIMASQQDLYNKFGGDTESFEPQEEEINFTENSEIIEKNLFRDSVSFYKDDTNVDSDVEMKSRKRDAESSKKRKDDYKKVKAVIISAFVLLLCVLAFLVKRINDLDNKVAKASQNPAQNVNDPKVNELAEQNKELLSAIDELEKNMTNKMSSSGAEVSGEQQNSADQLNNQSEQKPTQEVASKEVASKEVVAQEVVAQNPTPVKKPVVVPEQNKKQESDLDPDYIARTEAERNSVLKQDVNYTVVKGDSIIRLSKRFYGDATLYKKIVNANNFTDEQELIIGQKIIIPKK